MTKKIYKYLIVTIFETFNMEILAVNLRTLFVFLLKLTFNSELQMRKIFYAFNVRMIAKRHILLSHLQLKWLYLLKNNPVRNRKL